VRIRANKCENKGIKTDDPYSYLLYSAFDAEITFGTLADGKCMRSCRKALSLYGNDMTAAEYKTGSISRRNVLI
jgi:hypothetical protein